MFNLAKDGAVRQETHCVRDAQKNEINEKEESGFACERASGWLTVAKISVKDIFPSLSSMYR